MTTAAGGALLGAGDVPGAAEVVPGGASDVPGEAVPGEAVGGDVDGGGAVGSVTPVTIPAPD